MRGHATLWVFAGYALPLVLTTLLKIGVLPTQPGWFELAVIFGSPALSVPMLVTGFVLGRQMRGLRAVASLGVVLDVAWLALIVAIVSRIRPG